MSAIIQLHHVNFEFPDGTVIFDQLNLKLENKITALIGPNGVGKSTLARLIMQELHPTSGNIAVSQAINYFPQTETPPTQTVDEVFSFDQGWHILKQSLLEKIPGHLLCNQLSGGEWTRVRLAQLVHQGYIIFDEPTNNLDHEGRLDVMNFIRNHTSGCLLISHDRSLLQLASSVVELSNQGMTHFDCDWNEYCDLRRIERKSLQRNVTVTKNQAKKAAKIRQSKLERQQKRNSRGAKEAKQGGLPKIVIGAMREKAEVTSANLNTKTQLHLQKQLSEAQLALDSIKIDPVMYASIAADPLPNQKLVAEAKNFNCKYGDWLFHEDLSFQWKGNFRICIKGSNGSGKTSLVKALLGQFPMLKTKGAIHIADVPYWYLDQNYSSIDLKKSVLENILKTTSLNDNDARDGLAQFLFTKDSVFSLAETLSGGERLRLSLAQGLLNPNRPQLLVLDEPTNNLDLKSIEFLEELLRQFNAALLVISHDETFLRNIRINEEYLI